MEQEFGMTELGIWHDRLEHGGTLFNQWFERLSEREQSDVMVYLSMLNIVQTNNESILD
jgi:hypothetical protein